MLLLSDRVLKARVTKVGFLIPRKVAYRALGKGSEEVEVFDGVMRERGVATAFTSDRHFEQEGFVREPSTP